MKGQSKKEDLFLLDDKKDNHPSVYSTWPKFAIIPLELLRDNTISPTARLVYALYHSYCSQKSMSKESSTFVSQQRLANDLGKSRSFATNASGELVRNGWISVIRRGQGKSNIVVLHYKKSQTIGKAEQKRIQKEVEGRL